MKTEPKRHVRTELQIPQQELRRQRVEGKHQRTEKHRERMHLKVAGRFHKQEVLGLMRLYSMWMTLRHLLLILDLVFIYM